MNSKLKFRDIVSLFVALWFISSACNTKQAEPIKLNVDNCEQCKMTVADLKFATELITSKGRVYKFDDLKCMVKYTKENQLQKATYFVPDHNDPSHLLPAEKAFFVKGDNVRTPMNGSIASFALEQSANSFASETQAALITWEEVIK